MSDTDDFDWHALNYRTAHTVHAQAMWVELEACLQRKVAAAVAEAIAAKDAEIAALRAAIQKVVEAVEVNDSDTLSSITPDSQTIWIAEGSWSRPVRVTLGDLRKIHAAAREAG